MNRRSFLGLLGALFTLPIFRSRLRERGNLQPSYWTREWDRIAEQSMRGMYDHSRVRYISEQELTRLVEKYQREQKS